MASGLFIFEVVEQDVLVIPQMTRSFEKMLEKNGWADKTNTPQHKTELHCLSRITWQKQTNKQKKINIKVKALLKLSTEKAGHPDWQLLNTKWYRPHLNDRAIAEVG